jgi:formyltetrahydrofolate hydrolase
MSDNIEKYLHVLPKLIEMITRSDHCLKDLINDNVTNKKIILKFLDVLILLFNFVPSKTMFFKSLELLYDKL